MLGRSVRSHRGARPRDEQLLRPPRPAMVRHWAKPGAAPWTPTSPYDQVTVRW